uniref:PEP-CTERM sorting domain-containing protein n=1 Tax=Nitrosomonas sp. TaxID=42353 RepID=UPI0035AF2B4B
GWIDLIAMGINNNGQITGFGKLSDDPSHVHSFLLSFTPDTVFNPNPIFRPELPLLPLPVPEPQTYAMLLAGLGLLGFMAQRRKKRNLI